MNLRRLGASLFLVGFVLAAFPAAAQKPIRIGYPVILSGPGALIGEPSLKGAQMYVEEINAKGGVLGRKLEVTHADSQSNPGVARAQVQKALDAEPYVLLLSLIHI